MKKIIAVTLFFFLLLPAACAGAEGATRLLELRGKIFEEYQALQGALATTKDVAVVYGLSDQCLTTIIRLDAYFTMIGVMDSVRDSGLNENSLSYILVWLNGIKNVNGGNMKNLLAKYEVGKDTADHLKKVNSYFMQLGIYVDSEIKQLTILRDAFAAKQAGKK